MSSSKPSAQVDSDSLKAKCLSFKIQRCSRDEWLRLAARLVAQYLSLPGDVVRWSSQGNSPLGFSISRLYLLLLGKTTVLDSGLSNVLYRFS